MFSKTVFGLSTAAIMFAGAASAMTEASAWTDLNMRSGPGPMYTIIGLIPASGVVQVKGCLADASWCEVSQGDVTGWAAGNYLTAIIDSAPVALSTLDKRVVIETITYDNEAASATGGLATGAIAGAMIAGPVGAVVGGVIGAVTGSALAPDPTVISYVTTNPIDEVYLDGEVVVGAEIPDTVQLVQIPDSEYSYAYINGSRVLVAPEQRSVVYIVR